MHGDHGLSPTHEMYLKVLHRLEAEGKIGRVRDMATGLGVTAGTVSAVLKKLEQAGLVMHDRYGLVKLTPSGNRVAECVVRRFELLKELLVVVLGMDLESAEVDACAMEHAVSPATVNRIETLLTHVRSGEILVDAMHQPTLQILTCTECEALGACQAEANALEDLHRQSSAG